MQGMASSIRPCCTKTLAGSTFCTVDIRQKYSASALGFLGLGAVLGGVLGMVLGDGVWREGKSQEYSHVFVVRLRGQDCACEGRGFGGQIGRR